MSPRGPILWPIGQLQVKLPGVSIHRPGMHKSGNISHSLTSLNAQKQRNFSSVGSFILLPKSFKICIHLFQINELRRFSLKKQLKESCSSTYTNSTTVISKL